MTDTTKADPMEATAGVDAATSNEISDTIRASAIRSLPLTEKDER